MKQASAKSVFDAAGGRVLSEQSDVDFVLFMPGDHFEIVEEDEFEDAKADDDLCDEETSIVHMVRPESWEEIADEDEYEDGDDELVDSEYDTGLHFSREAQVRYEARAPYESHNACGTLSDDDIEELDDDIEFIEVDTEPEAVLGDEDITAVRRADPSWWESAKKGLRAIAGN